MRIALVDNGSLAPAAHLALRAAAAALGGLAGAEVEAVSWRHSDRIAADRLGGTPAWTLGPWLKGALEGGERSFLFVPFFISAQGAIGSALRGEIDAALAAFPGAGARFTAGLAEAGILPGIVADRVREAVAARGLSDPAVVLVDHGGPSPASAALRDAVAAQLRVLLGGGARAVVAASMEAPDGERFAFNRPLFAEVLARAPFDTGAVVAAPLFLSPGRHAGPEGDLARIAAQAAPGREVTFAGLVGSHPAVAPCLAAALTAELALVWDDGSRHR